MFAVAQMYAPLLEAQAISLELLLWMGNEDLERMGVLRLGHRESIRRALWEHILRHLRACEIASRASTNRSICA